MLEFIVLGQIPGTNVIVTFNWLLAFIAVALVSYDIVRVLRRRKVSDSSTSVKNITA